VSYFITVYIQMATVELKELEEELREGFTTLQSMINGHKDRTESSRLEWQRKIGLSDSDTPTLLS
jgi:hypothetical protein